MQVALGPVYAWSVFSNPLTKQLGWSIAQVTWSSAISILVLGVAAFFGGLWLNRRVLARSRSPRPCSMGLAFLGSFSSDRPWWLYPSYGLIGGIRLGFDYIIPVAVLVKVSRPHRPTLPASSADGVV
jgi:MFS transporter, OFA family, oxalate/formate antiporter